MGTKTEDDQSQDGVDWREESSLEDDTVVVPTYSKRHATPPPPPLPPQRQRQRHLDEDNVTAPCEPPRPVQSQHAANVWNTMPPPPPPPPRHNLAPSIKEKTRFFKEEYQNRNNGFQNHEDGLGEHNVQVRHVEDRAMSPVSQVPKAKSQIVRSPCSGPAFYENQGHATTLVPTNRLQPNAWPVEPTGMARFPPPPAPPSRSRALSSASVASDVPSSVGQTYNFQKKSSRRTASHSRSRSQSSTRNWVSKDRSVSPTSTVMEDSISYFSGKAKRPQSGHSSSSSNGTTSKGYFSRKSWRRKRRNSYEQHWFSDFSSAFDPTDGAISNVPESNFSKPETDSSETEPEDRDLSPTILVCQAFLEGRCNRVDCISRHPPSLIDRGKPWLNQSWTKKTSSAPKPPEPPVVVNSTEVVKEETVAAVKPPDAVNSTDVVKEETVAAVKPPDAVNSTDVVKEEIVATKASTPYEPLVEMSNVCEAFLEGKCADVECRLRHFPSGNDELIDWQSRFGGRLPCRWGIACQQKRCMYHHIGGNRAP